MSNWFQVDKAGLAKLMAGRSKAFVLYELLQNAWDQNVTRVDAKVEPVPGTRNALITVTDDDPDGFADLRHAYTLFAESGKKTDAAKRGRFNLGEKLVLALAKCAYIQTTTGSVEFMADGKRIHGGKRDARPQGSMFRATIPMTKAEIEETIEAAQRVIVPKDIKTTLNGHPLPSRQPVVAFEESLPTILADEEGVLRKITRKTLVTAYEPLAGETPMLYEMGIPVVETGDRYHVDVQQKVPLNMDRDNVTPAYLRQIRVAVLNNAFDLIDENDATQTWVKEACSDERVNERAVKCVMEHRFGADAVRYDPSDVEANKRSAAEGRQIVYGGNLSAGEWDNANRAGVLPKAGAITPSPKPYSPDGDPLDVIPEENYTIGMRQIGVYVSVIGEALLGCHVSMTIAREANWPYRATYGKGRLVFNASKCGYRLFEQGITDDLNKLIIHEFAHHYVSDHLSEAYYDACCDVGARLAGLALKRPELFQL